MQESKDSYDGKMSKKSSKNSSSSNQAISALCYKVKHLLSEDSLKVYSEKFLNKPIELEYYVDTSSEIEFRAKFLKPFPDHKLLKFIGLNKIFNPNHVKEFYYNLERTNVVIESRFKDCVIKFDYSDFIKHFGLKSEDSSLTIAESSQYDRILFV